MSILDAPGISQSQADKRYIKRWPVAVGETGVLNSEYKVGDSRRYGIFPDGVTNWESAYPARMEALKLNSTVRGITVFWTPGLYKTELNMSYLHSGSRMHFETGALFGGLIHVVSNDNTGAGAFFGASGSLSRVSGVVTLTSANAHGLVSADVGRTIVVQESVNPLFNGTFVLASVPTAITATWAQASANATSSDAWVSSRPIKNIKWTGEIATCDRLGMTVANHIFLERIVQVDDPTQHLTGLRGRGTHIYFCVTDLNVPGGISVEGCGADVNTWAGVSIDGDSVRPRRLTIGDMDIASDVNGAFLQFDDSVVGNIRVTDYGLSASSALAPGTVEAQRVRCQGVWIHRAGATTIGDIVVTQPPGAIRPFDFGPLLVSQTGSTLLPVTVTAGSIIAKSANGNRGVNIGDPGSPTNGGVDFICDSIVVKRTTTAGPLTEFALLQSTGSSQSGAGANVRLSCVDIRVETEDTTQTIAFSPFTEVQNSRVKVRGKGCLLESNARGEWGNVEARYQGQQTVFPNLVIAKASPAGAGLLRFVLPTETVDLRQWLDVGRIEFDTRGSTAGVVNSVAIGFVGTLYSTVKSVRARGSRSAFGVMRVVSSDYMEFGPTKLTGHGTNIDNRPVRVDGSVGVAFNGGKWESFKEQPGQSGVVSGTLENIDIDCVDTTVDATRFTAASWNQIKTSGFSFL